MRDEKQFLLDEIQEKLNQYPGFVLTDYAGLSANEAARLRTELRKLGTEMEVIRKRVLKKALENKGIPVSIGELKGHVGLIFATQDSIEIVKFICKYSKETTRPTILGGHFEGKFLNAKSVELLSTLPSRDEMRAQLLATFVAPLSQTLATVNALLTSVVYCLDNKAKKESQENN
jgi:large subunit ribosomal protein L10